MEFKEFRDLINKHFAEMTVGLTNVFEVDVDKDALWNLYLDSFPAGTNPIYRTNREYDCSCCRHFVKQFGNVVAINDGIVHTIWDVAPGDDKFQIVADAMSEYVKSRSVIDVHVNNERTVGTHHNYDDKTGEQYSHFFVEIPADLMNRIPHKSIGEIKGDFRATHDVFLRSLNEITIDSIDTVLELIDSNTLYRGTEWKSILNAFRNLKKKFDNIESERDKDLFAWESSVLVGGVIGRIRNHSIGTLLVNISEGMDLDAAVRQYESIVAPANYKRPKAIFTQKMLDDAKKTMTDLGLLGSVMRRYANIDDIRVNNILFANRDASKKIAENDPFAAMAKSIPLNPKKFTKVEEISAEKFISDVLPNAADVQVMLENRHAPNMVSLIAPVDANCKSMFKWDNNYSWAYSGNMTDSAMRDRVKAAGGKIDGVLRFSIQWNDGSEYDGNDLDAHCKEPNGHEIFFGDKVNYKTGGNLDVDIINPSRNTPAVENITWPNKAKMPVGKYHFFVHCYASRGGRSGFKAEIEFNGQIYAFEYDKELRYNETVAVADVMFDGANFTIEEKLHSNVSTKNIWGISTNQFVPVSVVCFSPNYWNENFGIGNKHLFFMLDKCENPERPNGFYNEFLREDLMKHKRVFEALGSHMKVADNESQLSGVGFCMSKRNDIVVKVKSENIERTFRVKF